MNGPERGRREGEKSKGEGERESGEREEGQGGGEREVYLTMCVCFSVLTRSLAVGTQFSSWEAILRDTEEEAKVQDTSLWEGRSMKIISSFNPALSYVQNYPRVWCKV